MDKAHFKRRIQITTGLFGLLLLGLGAAAGIVAVSRSVPVVLIPFAGASLISFWAIWWAHRSDACPAKPVDRERPTWLGQRSER